VQKLTRESLARTMSSRRYNEEKSVNGMISVSGTPLIAIHLDYNGSFQVYPVGKKHSFFINSNPPDHVLAGVML